MYSLDKAKHEIIAALKKALPEIEISSDAFSRPPQADMGDLALPCFDFAKALKKSPVAVAAELVEKLDFPDDGLVGAVAQAGPYLNFYFRRGQFTEAVVRDVLAAPLDYGLAPTTGRQVMVEYFSPNTHKEVHIGHLRNMAVGLSVSRLFEAAGHEVIPTTYIGDIGAHVAKCLWCLKKFHAGEQPTESRGRWLGSIYSEATRRIEEDETLKTEVSEILTKLEAGDPELTALWQQTRDWSIDEMRDVCAEFGMHFDRWYFESEVEADGKQMVVDLEAKGIVTESQGAKVVNLEDEKLGVFLVLKSDGNSLYSTKELALAVLKHKEYAEIDESVTVVDKRQSQYFQQFFATLKRMGFNWPMKHLSYDFVTLKEGAMSSRKGNIISYEDLRDEVKSRVRKEIDARHTDWSDEQRDETSWIIAEGALKFWLLRNGIEKPIVFDFEQALSFDGFTGPYVQYAAARLSSILRKAGVPNEDLKPQAMTDDADDYRLARKVSELPGIVLAAARADNPAIMAQYAFELAEAVNDFYRDASVISADDETKTRRLALCSAACAALTKSLQLLGIRTPDEM